jgi:hypothetical protein
MEREIPFRGDDYMLEVTAVWQLFGQMNEDYVRPELCDPIFEFEIFEYNETTMDYSQRRTEDLTAEENFDLQHRIKDWYWDHCASEAEAFEESKWDRR